MLNRGRMDGGMDRWMEYLINGWMDEFVLSMPGMQIYVHDACEITGKEKGTYELCYKQ